MMREAEITTDWQGDNVAIYEHISTFHGLPVADFDQPSPPVGPVAWRVAVDSYDPAEPFGEALQRFLTTVEAASVTALVIGPWGEVYEEENSATAIEALVSAKDKLPALTGLFYGDIVMEEAEISWIQQSDVSPLFDAFPGLTELVVRGGTGLTMRPVRHNTLRSLRFEAGGLPRAVIRAVIESELPALESLQLWLGVDEYGADWRDPDLEPLLGGERFTALRYLGLQNSDKQNHVARLAAESTVVRRLETLDLSLGTLTDEGAEPLLGLTHLKNLDLHHHFLSDEMIERLRGALEPAGVTLNLDGQEKPHTYDNEDYFYTAAAE
ncbi:STM4015 family protein [Actinocrispum wychmicini]|uniref:Leucine rich repeat (LRR) protein n=1 Tax=Actinocrispum wychmicini TaxID=1213861 RepID=A0A4V6NNS2_9PSEU|nr:STM4015 family protein [Actinocrispum wychmicini]TCO53720.1 hypothetical protein EV192_110310 [Actinocrispum wychmicini]